MMSAPFRSLELFASSVSRPWTRSNQQLVTILLFSLATIASFYVGTQVAVWLGGGRLLGGEIVQLDMKGGLLVGGLVGFVQWTMLRSARLPKAWIGMTAVGWAIAAGLNDNTTASLNGDGIDLLVKSAYFHPLTFLMLSFGQWLTLRQRVKVGWQWFLLPVAQMSWVLMLLAIVQFTMFGVFILSLIHSSQQSFWLPINGLYWISTAVYHLLILAHSTLPVLALCLLPKLPLSRSN